MSVALRELKAAAAAAKKKKKKKKKKKRSGKKKKRSKADEDEQEEEEEAIDVVDPWGRLPSAWGGRASPPEEYAHLLAQHDVWLDLGGFLRGGGGATLFLPTPEEEEEEEEEAVQAKAQHAAAAEAKSDAGQKTALASAAGEPAGPDSGGENETGGAAATTTTAAATSLVPTVAGVPLLGKKDLDRLVEAAIAPISTKAASAQGEEEEEQHTYGNPTIVETEKVYDALGGAHVTTRVTVASEACAGGAAGWEGDPWTPRSGAGNSAAGSPSQGGGGGGGGSATSPLAQVAAEEKAAAAARFTLEEHAARPRPDSKATDIATTGGAVAVAQAQPPLSPPKWMPRGADSTITTNAVENPYHRAACQRVSLTYLGLHHVDLSPKLRCSLVALDLSGNCLSDEALHTMTSVEMPLAARNKDLSVSCLPLFLRELRLCGNGLAVVPDVGEAAATLLALDLSHNNQLNIADPVSEARLAKMTRLRRLDLRHCNLSHVARFEPPPNSDAGQRQIEDQRRQRAAAAGGAPVRKVPPVCSLGSNTATLEYLDLSHNGVRDFEQFRSLAVCKRVHTLAIANNPVAKSMARGAYGEAVRKLCLKLSALKVFNGESYTHGMQASSFADLQAGREANQGVGAGGGDDAASCSCVEGNPCMVAYNCKDWAHRFEVAKAHGWKGF
jgi:hypothetical protein